jgi:predicted N-acetyltransferase YhbS
MAMTWSIEPIHARHDRTSFSCGERALDLWLKRHALVNDQWGLSKTQVVVRPGEVRVFGFYCLSNFTVQATLIPNSSNLPQQMPIPCTLLGRLARDVQVQGQGVGEVLMAHALRAAGIASALIGSYAVVVHAKDERAKNFYKRFGFFELLNDPLHLFLPMPMIRQLYP